MNRFSCRGILLTVFIGNWLRNDEEGFVICHKYSVLVRIEQQTGKLSLFDVDAHPYNFSVLDIIPHTGFRQETSLIANLISRWDNCHRGI